MRSKHIQQIRLNTCQECYVLQALGRLEKHCQRAGSHHSRPARSGSEGTAGGRQFESSSEKEVDPLVRHECTQLVRPRQGFSADRPTLLGIVARLCLAGGNLGKQRDKVLVLCRNTLTHHSRPLATHLSQHCLNMVLVEQWKDLRYIQRESNRHSH